MPISVDQIADRSGEELYRISKLYKFPDYVLSHAMPGTGGTEKTAYVAVTTYADPVRRQYPCHDKANTWLSAAFFLEKKAEFHGKEAARIEQRLEHYVDYWRIRPDYQILKTRHEQLHKSALDQLPDSAFAWVWVDDHSGQKDRRLPLRNPTEVKAAADWLHQYHERIPFKDRNIMAAKVLEKAASFGASVGGHVEFLERQAGRGVCNPADVVQMLIDRSKLAKDIGLRQHIVKMAECVRNTPAAALHPSMLVELAHTVETAIDKPIGLYGRYTSNLPRPEDVIFRTTFTKAATDFDTQCVTTSGKSYDKGQFAKLGLDNIRSLFGEEFADQVKNGLDSVDPEKMAELVYTLPRPEAELLDALMAESNLHPTMQKAASVKQGFTHADYQQWANDYIGTNK